MRAHLQHGPHRKQRRRVRRQAARLAETLSTVQRAALRGKAGAPLRDAVQAAREDLVPLLDDVLYHQPTPRRLKKARKAMKRARRTLDAAIADRAAA